MDQTSYFKYVPNVFKQLFSYQQNMQSQKNLSSLNKEKEFVQQDSNKFYPIIKNEIGLTEDSNKLLHQEKELDVLQNKEVKKIESKQDDLQLEQNQMMNIFTSVQQQKEFVQQDSNKFYPIIKNEIDLTEESNKLLHQEKELNVLQNKEVNKIESKQDDLQLEQNQMMNIFTSVLQQKELEHKLKEIEDYKFNKNIYSQRYFEEQIKIIQEKVILNKDKTEIIKNFQLPEIKGPFQNFINDIEQKQVNTKIHTFLLELENKFNQKQKKSLRELSKQRFFISEIKNFDQQQILNEVQSFIEDQIADFQSIYICKDVISLRYLFQVTSSESFVTFQENKSIKSQILFPDDNNLKYKNISKKKFDVTNYKKCFYTKLYLLLKFEQYQKCYANILQLRTNPNKLYLYDSECIDKIINFIKLQQISKEFQYLIEIFESQHLEQMQSSFKQYTKYLKENYKYQSGESLEKIINQTTLSILKHSLYFQETETRVSENSKLGFKSKNEPSKLIKDQNSNTQNYQNKFYNLYNQQDNQNMQCIHQNNSKNTICQKNLKNNNPKQNQNDNNFKDNYNNQNNNNNNNYRENNLNNNNGQNNQNNNERYNYQDNNKDQNNQNNKDGQNYSQNKQNNNEGQNDQNNNNNLNNQNNNEGQNDQNNNNNLNNQNNNDGQNNNQNNWNNNDGQNDNQNNQNNNEEYNDQNNNNNQNNQNNNEGYNNQNNNNNQNNQNNNDGQNNNQNNQNNNDGQNDNQNNQNNNDGENDNQNNQNNNGEQNNQNNDDGHNNQNNNGGQNNQNNENNEQVLINQNQQNRKYILQLDGGGLRGIIQLFFLSALEELVGQLCDDIFYFIGGTSIGGIIALALRIRKPAKEILEVIIHYFNQNIFLNGFNKYFNGLFSSSFNPDSNLYNILREQIFQDRVFSNIQKNTLVTSAYLDENNKIIPVCFVRFQRVAQEQNLQQNIVMLYKIESRLNDYNTPVRFTQQINGIQYGNAPLWQIAASSSAAYPFLNKFKFAFANNPYQDREFIDGGYLFNNVDILLIEFIKQIDRGYDQNNKLNDYILLSLGNQIHSQNIELIQPNEQDIELQLPSNLFQFIFQRNNILNKSNRNQQQSIFLTQRHCQGQQNDHNLHYLRLTPQNIERDIVLDDTLFETLDYMQLVGHRFIQQLGDNLQIFNIQNNNQFSQIENLEQIHQNDYQQLNDIINRINITEITENYQTFEQYCSSREGQEVENQLIDILQNFYLRNRQIKTSKMIDPKDNLFHKIIYPIQFFEDSRNIYKQQNFKGVLQLAASVESVKLLVKLLSLIEEFIEIRNDNINVVNYIREQIGQNRWNSLIGASANNRTRAFIFLMQKIIEREHNFEQVDLINNFATQNIQQQQQQNLRNILNEIVTNQQNSYKQFTLFKEQHNNLLEVSNQKFREIVQWWIN
ncbi:hypothetical protein ABPG72_020335 [Tetrahymena utriculariae]